MERTLSLVLDQEGKIALTLFTGTNQEIDEYTVKNFVNSDEIRKKYQDIIEPFLSANHDYIEKASSNRFYRGRIVILETVLKDGELHLIEQRVLYKSAPHVAKEAIKSKKVMDIVVAVDTNGSVNSQLYNLLGPKLQLGKFQLSGFVKETVSRFNYPTKTNLTTIRNWLKSSDETYYEKVRLLVSSYIYARKLYPNLKTVDAIYKDYLKKRSDRITIEPAKPSSSKNIVLKDDQQFVNIDGVLYPVDDIPFDNDELISMDIDPFNDGMIK